MDEGIIIHIMEKEGIVRELSFLSDRDTGETVSRQQKSFLAELVSSAEAMALVHDLELDMIDYRSILYYLHQEKPLDLNKEQIKLPKSIHILFERQKTRDTLLNASAILWGFEKKKKRHEVLSLIVDFYKGLKMRRRAISNYKEYRDVIEEKLSELALYLEKHPEKMDQFQIQSDSDSEVEDGRKYSCVGLYSFYGTIIDQSYCLNGHIVKNSTTKCSICNQKVFNQPMYRMETITFASLTSQVKPSDALRYIILWPNVGQRIVRAFIRQDIWEPVLSNILLIPEKIKYRSNEGNILSMWSFQQNKLTVAIYTDNPLIESEELLFSLEEHKEILKEKKWHFQDLVRFYGLSMNFSNEIIINQQQKMDSSLLLDLDFK